MKRMFLVLLFLVLAISTISCSFVISDNQKKHSEEIVNKDNQINSLLSELDDSNNKYNELSNIREIDTQYIDFTMIADPDNGSPAYMLGQGRCSDTIFPIDDLSYGIVVPTKEYLTNIKNGTTVDCPAYVYLDKETGKWIGSDVQLNDNYLPVVAVSNYAFFDCANLVSISLPNTIKQIGANAFYKCTGLTSITLPTSLNRLFRNAFSGCSNIINLTILSKKLTINNGAFKGLVIDLDFSNLDELTISGLAFREYAGEKVVFPKNLNVVSDTFPYFISGSNEIIDYSNITDNQFVFNNCANLKVLDFSKVTDCSMIGFSIPNLFRKDVDIDYVKFFVANCPQLEQVFISPSFLRNCLLRFSQFMGMEESSFNLFFYDNFLDDYSNVKFLLGKDYSVSDVALLDFDFLEFSNSNIVDMFVNGRGLDFDFVENGKLMPYQIYYYEADSHTESDHYDTGTSYLPLYYYTITDGVYSYSSCSSHIKNVLS